MKYAILTLIASLSLQAAAGLKAYSGLGGEKLFIEDAPKLGSNVALIKFEGIETPWAGKVIQTKREKNERYTFEYDLELSSGVQKRTYQILEGKGFELRNGSRVPKIELYYPEMTRDNPGEFVYDAELTKASQKLDLAGEHKKSPFKPDVP